MISPYDDVGGASLADLDLEANGWCVIGGCMCMHLPAYSCTLMKSTKRMRIDVAIRQQGISRG